MPTDTSPSVTEAEKLVERLRTMRRRPDREIDYDAAHLLDEAADLIERLTLPVDETQLVDGLRGAFERHLEEFDYTGPGLEVDALLDAALSIVRPHLSEIERLRAQLEEARGEAFDEAAEVADLWGTAYAEQDAPTGEAAAKDIASAIRARISGRG